MDDVKFNAGQQMNKVTFEGIIAKNLKIESSVTKILMRDCEISFGDFSAIEINDSSFIETKFSSCNFRGSFIQDSLIEKCFFLAQDEKHLLDMRYLQFVGTRISESLFMGVGLSDSEFYSLKKPTWVEKSTFVLCDFNDFSFVDSIANESFICFPWNSRWKFHSIMDNVNKFASYMKIPIKSTISFAVVFPINPALASFAAVFTMLKTSRDLDTDSSFLDSAVDRFNDIVLVDEIGNMQKNECINMDKIVSARDSKFHNTYGMSDNMEEVLRSKGATVSFDVKVKIDIEEISGNILNAYERYQRSNSEEIAGLSRDILRTQLNTEKSNLAAALARQRVAQEFIKNMESKRKTENENTN
jgi:predicted DNA-binding protein (UPF0251 family)